MQRVITDELLACGFSVLTGQRQASDNGMPIFNGSGEPKMEPVWVLVFTQADDSTQHVLKIPFDKDGKDRLVAALTGGIVPATLGDIPLSGI